MFSLGYDRVGKVVIYTTFLNYEIRYFSYTRAAIERLER